jgi:hypothetical protein
MVEFDLVLNPVRTAVELPPQNFPLCTAIANGRDLQSYWHSSAALRALTTSDA